MAERPGRVAAEHLLRRTGYDRTGDDASDRALVRTGVGQHEAAMHAGRPRTKLRLQGGGRAHDAFGPVDPQRFDRSSRRSHEDGRAPRINILEHGGGPSHPEAGAMGQQLHPSSAAGSAADGSGWSADDAARCNAAGDGRDAARDASRNADGRASGNAAWSDAGDADAAAGDEPRWSSIIGEFRDWGTS